MSARQTTDAHEEALVDRRQGAVCDERPNCPGLWNPNLRTCSDDRRDVRREDELPAAFPPVQRLLPKGIRRERQALLLLVPHAEREHAVDAVEGFLAPFVPCVQEHL